MSQFTNDLRNAVYESVIDILISKGVEERICLNVAGEVLDLFDKRVVLKQEKDVRKQQEEIIKRAILEADKKYLSGPN